MFDLIIRNGLVCDGTGRDAYRADIGVRDGRIAAIGDLSVQTAKSEYDAHGKTVAPGFIEPHSHADLSILFFPSMESYLRQGVTTVVGGNCGHSFAPVGDEVYRAAIVDQRVMFRAKPSYFESTSFLLPLEKAKEGLREEYGIEMDWSSFSDYIDKVNSLPPDANIVPLAGYSAIRAAVMGTDCLREATPEELDRCEALTRRCMDEGAFGLSSGTDPQYIPGPFATDEEMVRMLKVVAERGGVFASHTRNVTRDGRPDRMEGYREMLRQARAAGVRAHVSHVHTLGMGATPEACAQAARDTLRYFEEEAANGLDLSFDVIPSPYSMDFTVPYFATFLRLFVLMSGSRQQLARNLRVPDFCKMVRLVIENGMYPLLDPKEITSVYSIVTVSRHKNPAHLGKNLAQYARELGRDPLDLTLELFAEDCDMCGAMALPGMDEANKLLCEHPLAIPCADGISGSKDISFGLNEDIDMMQNPMGLSFMIRWMLLHGKPRFEDTIRQITGFVAERFNIPQRGRLEEGYFADIVVLDRSRLKSHDRDENPLQYPEGIDLVVVNGVETVRDGAMTGAHAGRMLRKN